MAHYDIFREQLAIKYPEFGYALWEPSPSNPDRPVQVGDVGFTRRGNFYRLFKALLPAEDPSQDYGVPEYHEPLVPRFSDHIHRSSLSCNHYCSAGVSVESEPDTHAGPDDFPRVSFTHSRRRVGAVLSLPVRAQREDTLAQGDFGKWMVKHIDYWFAFARELGLGIERMEDIILVTGCDRTRSWANIAFSGGQHDARISFRVKAIDDGPNTSVNFQFSPECAQGALFNYGPEGENLPENQCVFIRGFRAARTLRIMPKHLKAAAGPSRDSGGDDYEPDTELVSIPTSTKNRDPLYLLLDYIAERAPDCDMVLVHDDDLERIDGMGSANTLSELETLKPDVPVVKELLRRSSNVPEIHTARCDLSHANRSPNPDSDIVRVAMLSTTICKDWNIAPQTQVSFIATQDTGLPHTGESSASSLSTPRADHFIGYVETTTDALRLVMAARLGIIPRITRRLNDSERRSMIRSGAVFVFCVEESGIKRWIEGLSWSPSRIVGNFLMYREVGERNSNRGVDTALLPPGTSTSGVAPPSSPVNPYYYGRSDPGGAREPMRPSGLIKKTITVKVSGTDHHLVSYYREEDVARGLLQRPTSRPDIMRLTIPPEMVRATNFRHPPHVEVGPDGKAQIYDIKPESFNLRGEGSSLHFVRDRMEEYSPYPVLFSDPIQQSRAFPAPARLPTRNLKRPLDPDSSQVPANPAQAPTDSPQHFPYPPGQ